jgi:DNA (cytosine-5)-methyltransferase 1
MKKNSKSYTVGGLFSGVGGLELGFINNGFNILWSNDIDEPSSHTFKANFKHKHILRDINLLRAEDVSPVDVLIGGFPCQAFSVAGYRKGFKDERGNLFFQIARLIEELEYKPKALLLENVKNFYTHDHGKTFRVVKECLEDLGYCVFTKILNTSDYTNVPQNRERTFIVCFLEGSDAIFDPDNKMSYHFNKIFPPPPVNKPDHIKNYLEGKKVDKKYYYGEEKYMYKELLESIKSTDTMYQWRRQYVRENKSNVCPTLTANMGTGGHNVPLIKDRYGFRKLTPRECFNLQGFPNSFVLPESISTAQLYKQAGNSVTVTLISSIAACIKEALDQKYS